MPITFQPPDPVAPYTSAAYGGGQQYSQDAGVIANAYQQQNQIRLAEAQMYSQAQQASASRSNAAGQAYMQQSDQQAQQQFVAQQQANQQAQQAQLQQQQQYQQAQEQNQQAQLAVQANQVELSQAEEMQLQKYKAGDAWVDSQLADNSITPEMASSMKAQLRGLKGPLELRQELAKTQLAQSQAKQQQQLVDQETQQQLKKAGLAAKSALERTVPITNPEVEARIRSEMGDLPEMTGPMGAIAKAAYEKEVNKRVLADPNGVQSYIYTDTDGKTYLIKPDKSKANTEQQDMERARGHWESVYKKEASQVDAIIKKTVKDNPATADFWTSEKRDEAVRNRMQAAVGTDTLEDYLAKNLTGQMRAPHVPGKTFGLPSIQPRQGPSQPTAGPAALAPTGAPQRQYVDEKPQPPFSYGALDKATPQQREAVKLWEQLDEHSRKADLPQADKERANQAVQWGIKKLEQYGSVANMEKAAPEDAAHYLAIQKAIAGMPQKKSSETSSTNPISATARFVRNPGRTIVDSLSGLSAPSFPDFGFGSDNPGRRMPGEN